MLSNSSGTISSYKQVNLENVKEQYIDGEIDMMEH